MGRAHDLHVAVAPRARGVLVAVYEEGGGGATFNVFALKESRFFYILGQCYLGTCFWSPTRMLFRRRPVLAIIVTIWHCACSVQLPRFNFNILSVVCPGNVQIVQDMLR